MPNDVAQKQLTSIATLAYGSRCYEGTGGGRGNIGFISGHVVKFNTHKGSGGSVTDAMLESCNRLRLRLDKLAVSLLSESGGSCEELQDEIASIRAKLGLSADGQKVVATGLLDRKVVASVVRQIDARTGANSFREAQFFHPSSRHQDTRFRVVAADLLARKFMEDHKVEVGELLGKLPGARNLSAGNRKMLENVLQRSLEAICAEKDAATMDDLSAEGSAFDSISKLATVNLFNMRMVNLALTLPAKEVAPFLKACRIFPDAGFRTIDRFCAVAPRLAKLSPSKFTLENILKLARPGEFAHADLENVQVPMDTNKLLDLNQPKSDLINENLSIPKFSSLLALGGTILEANTYSANPKSFSVTKLPKTAFLPSTTLLSEDLAYARGAVSKDFPRLPGLQVEILEPGGQLRYKMPEEMRDGNAQVKVDEKGKSPLAHFMDQIERLCGKDNVAQQQLVLLSMTQNALMPETLFDASQGVLGNDINNNMKFLLKADPATGDVFVSRTTDPAKAFGMSVTMRIGRDGSMSVVNLQERKTPGELIPLDGNGNPMAVDGPVVSSQLKQEQKSTLDVDTINGKLTTDQLAKLYKDPTKTSGPVVVQYPEDIEMVKKGFADKYKGLKEKSAPAEGAQPQCAKMKGTFARGDFVFKIGPDKTFDPNVVNNTMIADQLNQEIWALMNKDPLLVPLLDVVFGEYLTNPFAHQMLEDNYAVSFKSETASSSDQTLSLNKNKDGSYRIAISAKAKDVKEIDYLGKNGFMFLTIKENTQPSNSVAYEIAFDLKMGKDGPVVTLVDDRQPTLTFDLRGNEFVHSERPLRIFSNGARGSVS